MNNQIINRTNIVSTDIIMNPHYVAEPGKFRFITKCQAGYMICNDARDFDDARLYANPASVLSAYKKGALQSVQYKPVGSDVYFTVFAKKGNKIIIMDEAIMRGLDVACVNQLWYNTNLMDHNQYKAVNSTSWASKVFVMNEAVEVEVAA